MNVRLVSSRSLAVTKHLLDLQLPRYLTDRTHKGMHIQLACPGAQARP